MAAMLRLIPVCFVFSNNTSNGLYPLQNSQQTDGYRSRYHPGPAPGPALVGFLPARYHALASDECLVPMGPTRLFKASQNRMEFGKCPDEISPAAGL